MKKIRNLFLTFLACACFSACDLEEIVDIAPTDEWVVKEFEIEDETGGGDSTVYCYFYYSTEDDAVLETETATGKEGEYELKPGLTIAAMYEYDGENTTIDNIVNGKYALKTLEEGTSVNSDGEDTEGGKFTISKTLWSAIYLLNVKSMKDESERELEKSDYVEEASDFNFKKIFTQILVDKLLEE